MQMDNQCGISSYAPHDSESPKSEPFGPVIILVSASGFWPNFSSSNYMHTKHPIQLQYWRERCLFPNTNCSVTCQYIIEQQSLCFSRVAAFNGENRDPYRYMQLLSTAPKTMLPTALEE